MSAGRHILMTTDTVGGVWVYATTLAGALAARGDRVTLVTLGPAPNADQHAAIQCLSGQVGLVATDLALEWVDPEGRDRQRAAAALTQIARGLGPDVVHLNGFREGAIAWPAPTLVVAHSCVLSWWQACRGTLPTEPRWMAYMSGVDAGLRACDAWVAPSETLRCAIQAIYGPPTVGMVIHNGIELPGARPGAKQNFVLASGRVWDPAKNLMSVLAAAPALPWPVEIAGPTEGPDGAVTASAANIRLRGMLPRSVLRERMRAAAIYVAPARYEPFGLGVLEAAGAGCALVLSDIASMRELWDDAALFVAPDDAPALKAALRGLCGDHDKRAALQQAAIARAARYAIDHCATRYGALYDMLLGRAATAPTREARA